MAEIRALAASWTELLAEADHPFSKLEQSSNSFLNLLLPLILQQRLDLIRAGEQLLRLLLQPTHMARKSAALCCAGDSDKARLRASLLQRPMLPAVRNIVEQASIHR